MIAGITNDNNDPSVDTFRTTTLPLLRQFGVPVEDLELKIVMRGAPPLGGGEVHLKVPIVHPSLRVSSFITFFLFLLLLFMVPFLSRGIFCIDCLAGIRTLCKPFRCEGLCLRFNLLLLF